MNDILLISRWELIQLVFVKLQVLVQDQRLYMILYLLHQIPHYFLQLLLLVPIHILLPLFFEISIRKLSILLSLLNYQNFEIMLYHHPFLNLLKILQTFYPHQLDRLGYILLLIFNLFNFKVHYFFLLNFNFCSLFHHLYQPQLMTLI